MGYTEFKKQAGIVDWATDKVLGSYFGKDNYQKRQDTYNEIKNKPVMDNTPYTVGSSISNTVTGAKPSTDPGNPDHVIGNNAFNNERINNIQDAATRDAYMDFVLKGGAMAQQLQDTNYDPSKLTLNDVANNKNVVNSIGAALENASPASLDSFIRISEQYQKASKGGADFNGVGATQVNPAIENAKKQLTGSFLKGVWKNVKANPIEMVPQIAGMFLRHLGAGDTVANFASDPMKFYISLAGLLLGGGLLLSGGFGGSNSRQPQIIINNGGQQLDPRLQRVPYSY